MSLPLYQIDAFTDRAFRGNPAAVVFLTEDRPDEWMQSVAAEMNLAETAFVRPEGKGFRLRWFTPMTEVDLCGHATLATAHALWSYGYLPDSEDAVFETRSGTLTCRPDGGWIKMDFPAIGCSAIPIPEDLEKALGTRPYYAGRGGKFILAEVGSEETVRNLKPNMQALKREVEFGVIVTAESAGGEFDFVSRFFAPSVGIDEDPVTGAAHCCLTPYWAKRLNKDEFTAFQASSRGGVVRTRLEGERVVLSGQAVTVLTGELHA